MPYYRSLGEIPPKRHTQHRRPDGGPVLRGAHGGGGLLLRLLAALPPRHPVGDRRLPRRGTLAGPRRRRPTTRCKPRHLQLHDLFAVPTGKALDAVTGRRLVLGNGDVRISYVVAGDDRRRSTATASATSASTSRRARPGSRRCSARSTWRRATTSIIPRATTHRWIPTRRASRCAPTASRRTATSRRRKRYLSQVRPAPRARAVLRARPARARGAAARRGRRRDDVDRGLHQAPGHGPGGIVGTVTTYPTTRSTSSAGTAASTRTSSTSATSSRSPGACTSRRRCTRCSRARTSSSATSCRARSTTTRCRSRCRTTTPTSTATRSCSTRRRLRGAQGLGHRAGLDLAAPGRLTRTARSRAPSERSIGVEYFDELAVMVDTFRPLELGEAGVACDDGATPGPGRRRGRADPDERRTHRPARARARTSGCADELDPASRMSSMARVGASGARRRR